MIVVLFFCEAKPKQSPQFFINPAALLLSSSVVTEGLLIYFLPVEENKLITLQRSVILFSIFASLLHL